jgi:hypothetical protein
VFFADHLLHSIQVDAIMETVQRNTLAVIEDGLLAGSGLVLPGTWTAWLSGGRQRSRPGTSPGW